MINELLFFVSADVNSSQLLCVRDKGGSPPFSISHILPVELEPKCELFTAFHDNGEGFPSPVLPVKLLNISVPLLLDEKTTFLKAGRFISTEFPGRLAYKQKTEIGLPSAGKIRSE